MSSLSSLAKKSRIFVSTFSRKPLTMCTNYSLCPFCYWFKIIQLVTWLFPYYGAWRAAGYERWQHHLPRTLSLFRGLGCFLALHPLHRCKKKKKKIEIKASVVYNFKSKSESLEFIIIYIYIYLRSQGF